MNHQLPNSWLFSENFLKRAFAIWGHYFVANLIIGFPFVILGIFLALWFSSAIADLQTSPTDSMYMDDAEDSL